MEIGSCAQVYLIEKYKFEKRKMFLLNSALFLLIIKLTVSSNYWKLVVTEDGISLKLKSPAQKIILQICLVLQSYNINLR